MYERRHPGITKARYVHLVRQTPLYQGYSQYIQPPLRVCDVASADHTENVGFPTVTMIKSIDHLPTQDVFHRGL